MSARHRLEPLKALVDFGVQRNQTIGQVVKVLPGACQGDPFPAAQQQLRSDLFFKLRHMLGDGRLRDTQPGGRCRETALAHHISKGDKLMVAGWHGGSLGLKTP